MEQFNVITIYILKYKYFDISFTNIILPLLFVNIILIILIFFFKNRFKLIPNSWQYFFELFYNFVLNLLKQQVNIKGLIYFPFIFTIFNFILICNLLSLIPFGIALTSHLILILFLSITIGISIFIIGLLTHSLNFLKIFIPECPLLLLPILIPIEIFSYLIRMFSLAIRLAANILAGHTLVSIIATFILKLTKKHICFYLIFIWPLFAILLLELGVAFLQAFVFTILISIYLSDSLKSPIHK